MSRDNSVVHRIYVDARCLQDPRFRDRGIGQHVSNLLAGANEFAPPEITPHLIGCVDRSMAPLDGRARALFAEELPLAGSIAGGSTILQLSPMTHSPHPLRAALENPAVRSVAIVYDFIPLDFPADYLRHPAARREYLSNLAVLHDYDKYISISEFTSYELQTNLGVMSRDCHVSGVAVRESVIRFSGSAPTEHKFCLVIGGGDKRKNVELPIVAHAKSSLLRSFNVSLKIVGHYSEADRNALIALHRREGGTPRLLQFIEGISDGDLASLYQGALVTVCPSRAEGFSIPVVEANANGCPVIISNCPAQVELMPLPEYQFDPDDVSRVGTLMESFLDQAAGTLAMKKQGNFWTRFQPTAVQQRFWSAFFENDFDHSVPEKAGQSTAASPYIVTNRKPRMAIASPVPPDRSGVADYTMATMTAMARYAELDLFTETQGRIVNRAFETIQPLSADPYVRGNYDAVVSVLGNSHLHLQTFNLLLNYGGAAIMHDARMLHFYYSLLGPDRTKAVASREAERRVSMDEINGWIENQKTMPVLFLSEILEAAKPAFVHSPTTRDLIDKLYGRETIHLPFAAYRARLPEFEGAHGRAAARALLGISQDERLLVCLGDLVPDKAPEECMWTASMLREWGVPIRLEFVGNSQPEMVAYLRSIAELIGVGHDVRFTEGVVDERKYQAYLAAADAAIQLRNYEFGGLSGAMLDGIAAGLPTIANVHLAEAMESPSYVARIPDGLSPVLAAEKLLEIFETGREDAHEGERLAFLEAHSVDAYAKRLLNGLGFA